MSTAMQLYRPQSKMGRIGLDFLRVMSPGAASIAEPQSGDPHLSKTIVPGAAVGVVGFFVWRSHPVLGFLAGDALGLNAARLIRGTGDDRKTAACNLGLAASGIVGSLLWKRHPFYAWWIGHILGAAALVAVPGSNSHRFVQSVMGKR
jgi:hypothetical protein